MRPGQHAAGDGSFARSAGGAGARGLALLAVALVLGIVLLNATDADPPGTTVSSRGDSDTSGGSDDDDADGEGSAASTTLPVAPVTTASARAPKDVKVIVANASSTKGAAGGAGDRLKALGFNVLAPTNATAVPDSAVYFTTGFDRDAAAIAAALQLPPAAVKPMPAPPPLDTKDANVAVVLGTNDAPKFGTATTTAAGGATTTTAKAGAGGSTSSTAPATTAATSTTKKP